MGNTKKFTLTLILLLAASSLTVVSSVSGQSLKPVVTEFSLQYVDNSYDVPPEYEYTKDLYTGETITTTIPGYRVENRSIVATIKNPSGVDAYNFRWKSQDDSSWHYHPFNTETDQTLPLSASGVGGPPAYASDSEYTVVTLFPVNRVYATPVDVQVQALYGDYRARHNTPIQIEGDYYDYYFDGQASYWSDTQTVTINDSQAVQNTPAPPTSTPTVTATPTSTPMATSTETSSGFDLMQTAVVVLAVVVAVLAAVIVLVFRHYHKPK